MTADGQAGQAAQTGGICLLFLPNSVTPVHFDIEHSLSMQVRGSKIVSVGRFKSDAARRHEFDRYRDGSHGRIETLQPEAAVLPMTPGGRCTCRRTPHWLIRFGHLVVRDPHVLHRCHGRETASKTSTRAFGGGT